LTATHDALEPVVSRLRADFDVHRDTGNEAPRRYARVDGEAQAMQRIAAELPRQTLVEPELARFPASPHGIVLRQALASQGPSQPAGLGKVLSVQVRGEGKPIVGAKTLLMLANLGGRDTGTRLDMVTDEEGEVAFPYDPALWLPALLTIEPRNGFWDWWGELPQGNLMLNLPPLAKTGPIGWWHRTVGMAQYARGRGEGIRIGVIDTGVGPHPYLQEVTSAGAVTGGSYDSSDQAGRDALGHGTHVCGIIAARPVEGSGDYCGIADGARVISIRVFGPDSNSNQGDVAQAIDHLVFDQEVDLINMSLGGNQPSQIERESIQAAADGGTLCVAAVGNGFGQALMFPSAYDETVAVSALGMLGAYPSGTMAARCIPNRPDQFGPGGVYLALFSNIGPGVSCAAPGSGIISTVPARPEVVAPYMAFNGTSMAAPVVTAALASVLARDPLYRLMPRNADRTRRASAVLFATLAPLGLSPAYVGAGMSQAWPM